MVICDTSEWGGLTEREFRPGAVVLDDTAIAEGDNSFGVGGDLGLMRHEQDGEPLLPVELGGRST